MNSIKDFLFKIKKRSVELDLIYFYVVLKIKKIFKIGYTPNKIETEKHIDILIVTTSKDFELLNEVVKSTTKINHIIDTIHIVGPNDIQITDYCSKNNLKFIDENSILGYSKDTINYFPNGIDRRGWFFQQLLKLSGDKLVTNNDFFIIDSDTIITDNIDLIDKRGRYIFYQSEEWHHPYSRAFEILFGYKRKSCLSYVSHMMIFNKGLLGEMRNEIEKKHGVSWDEAHKKTIDNEEQSCVSEYENYANWVRINKANKFSELPLYNLSLPRSKLGFFKNNLNLYYKKYKTVSFHSYHK